MAKKTETRDDLARESATTPDDNQDSVDQKEGWKYSSENSDNNEYQRVENSFEDISWSASEYIAHDKNIAWYMALGLITAIITVADYLLTHNILSAIVVIVAGGVLGFYAGRKPRLLNYKIDSSGLTIENKVFSFDSFKSFAIIEGSALPNIVLMPLKRFMPSLSIYLDPESQEKVIDVLSARLPQDVDHTDLVDRFAQRVRF